MRKVVLVLVVVWLIALAGCKTGPRIVDNQYQVMGMPAFTVDQSFDYVGSPNVKDYGRCTGVNCTPLVQPIGHAVTDLFVRKEDNTVQEIVMIQRNQAPSGYSWNALKGNLVDFGGREYLEGYVTYTSLDEGGAVVSYLTEQGHEFAKTDYEIRLLARNVTNSKRIHLLYSCSGDLMPQEVRADSGKRRDWLVARFHEVITLPED